MLEILFFSNSIKKYLEIILNYSRIELIVKISASQVWLGATLPATLYPAIYIWPTAIY
jgi:hypothetical protein